MLRNTLVLLFISQVLFSQTIENIDQLNPSSSQTQKGGTPNVIMAPTNDGCAGAISLTPGAACTAGTTNAATSTGDPFSGSSCIPGSGAGCNVQGVWYSFTATNDSLNLNIDNTSTGALNCNAGVSVYGPGTACTPSNTVTPFYCQYQINQLQSWNHLITGLTIGQTYLIFIEDHSGGGPGQGYMDFCINVTNPKSNDISTNATQINDCGVSFTGSTANANSSGCSSGLNDLDCNGGTTCGTCTSGDDVTFSIENDSWFYFCASSTGTYNVTLNNVTGCSLPSGYGVQLAIFSGTTSSLTQIQQAVGVNGVGGGGTNPSSWTSNNFTVTAGNCVYMMVDGYAGNECSYDFTLTNVAGGCLLLPVEIINLTAQRVQEQIRIDWSTISETDNKYFTIERSKDAIHFEYAATVNGAGSSNTRIDYSAFDEKPYGGVSYYRLKQTDYDGNEKFSNIVSANYESSGISNIWVTYLEEEVSFHFDKDSDREITYSVCDVSGKLIASGKKDCTKGANKMTLRADSYAPGMYILTLSDGNSEKQQKFISH